MTGGSKRWLVALLVVGLVLAAGWWLLGPVAPPKGVTLSDLGGVDHSRPGSMRTQEPPAWS